MVSAPSEGDGVCAISRRAASCLWLSSGEWAELWEVIEHSPSLWNEDALNPWSALSDHISALAFSLPCWCGSYDQARRAQTADD